MLRVIRNKFIKVEDENFWKSYSARLRDLFRRFVAATLAPIRFGLISDDGATASLWATDGLDDVAIENSQAGYANRLFVFKAPGNSRYFPLFPIDDYIRLHRDDGSVYASFSGSTWLNLTFKGDLGKAAFVNSAEELLPDEECRTNPADRNSER